MRVITRNASDAFAARKKYSGSNTMVTVSDAGTVSLYLFGKHIAEKDKDGIVKITNAGWPTVTTVDRLRGIGANVHLAGGKRNVHRSATMYLNDQPMENGKWYFIDGGKVDSSDSSTKSLAAISSVMMMGDIFASNTKDRNAWKLRMLKAGIPEGMLHLPDDFDSLPEAEKEKRLNAVIAELKG